VAAIVVISIYCTVLSVLKVTNNTCQQLQLIFVALMKSYSK